MNGNGRGWRRGAAILAALAVAGGLGAYPIPPRTLWNLTQEAELVVVARVDAEGRLEGEYDPESWTPSRARLAVVEVLKGDRRAASGTIEVAYHPEFICPAPPRFVEGRTVLAFLARDAESNQWVVPHLSYGTLYPRERDLPLFRDLIAEALARQQRARKPGRPPIDWLVAAAERRATRWHGLYELAAELDEVHSYYDRRTDREDLRTKLGDRQRARIARGFVLEPSADLTFVQTLGVVGDLPDEELDRTAMGLIEAMLREEDVAYWASDAIERTLQRLGDESVGDRLRALGEHSWDRSTADLRELWEKAKVDLALPEVEPLVIEAEEEDEAEVRGVGGTTPS